MYSSLTAGQKEALREMIARQQEELLAARSEDERTRRVHEYIKEIHDYLQGKPKLTKQKEVLK